MANLWKMFLFLFASAIFRKQTERTFAVYLIVIRSNICGYLLVLKYLSKSRPYNKLKSCEKHDATAVSQLCSIHTLLKCVAYRKPLTNWTRPIAAKQEKPWLNCSNICFPIDVCFYFVAFVIRVSFDLDNCWFPPFLFAGNKNNT